MRVTSLRNSSETRIAVLKRGIMHAPAQKPDVYENGQLDRETLKAVRDTTLSDIIARNTDIPAAKVSSPTRCNMNVSMLPMVSRSNATVAAGRISAAD